mgnify:CR=1 FL=1
MEYDVLKKLFLYFYERKFDEQSDFDKKIMQNLYYQLQVTGLTLNDGFSFLLEDGKIYSLDFMYSLRRSIIDNQNRSKYIPLSSFALNQINELQRIKDIIVYSYIMQQHFSSKELEEEKHILYWMDVVSSTHYINNNISTKEGQTLDILNQYFPHKEINNVAVESNHLQKLLER